MTRKRHMEEQIIAVLKDAQAGSGVQELFRKHGISGATLYKWRPSMRDWKSRCEETPSNGRRKPALEADGGGAGARHPGAEGDHRKKLVTPKAKRASAQWVAERFDLSERGVCRVVPLDRNTLRYHSRREEDAALQARIREIAEAKSRYGCPRIAVRQRREGWLVNHKKVERINYRDERLSLRRRQRKKAVAVPRIALPRPTRPGLCYAMDFVHARLANGRRFKCLTMTDLCSKEVPVSKVDVSIGGTRVRRILDRLFLTCPLPETVILDNGPEFAGTALDAWAAQHGVHRHFIQPGKPVQNAFTESFNGKFLDECLKAHWLPTLQDAQLLIEAWRRE